MHTLYILLFALGIYSSVGLIRVGQTSSTSPCQIILPFTNSHISAFYEQSITGTGCATNMTTNTNQEVHIISLKKAGPVFRNDVAEVHLLIKSRTDEVLREPLIIVLNSNEPVKWKIRTEILTPAWKKHIFVIPTYSSVKLVKSISRRIVRKFDQLPQKKEKLKEWVQDRFGAVTSFTELEKGNQITLHVGLNKTSSSGALCDLKTGQAKLVEASYEQPQLLSGCIVQPRTDIMSRVAYVIELENVDPNPNRKNVVEVELEIKGGSKRTTRRDFWLVLKSPPKVNWKIKTKKLQGYAEIVSNSHIDMTGIKMDPVSDRIEDFTESGQKFLKWVEIYVGPVAMYTSITLANKIKMVIPDNDGHEKSPIQLYISPFDNVALTKSVFRQHTQTECIGQGAIRVSLRKNVYQTFDLELNQLTFLSPSCTATQNSTHVLWESAIGECRTQKITKDGQTRLHNAILIHRSSADAIETGSGSRKDNSGDEDELNSSGSGSYNPVTETYIDDEDYEQLDTIKNDVSCLLPDFNNADLTTVSNNNKTVPNVIPHATMRPHKNNIGNSDISFHVELFKTPYYTEANYKYPMNVSLKSNIYVDAFIQGDISMRVQIISCQLSKEMDRESSSIKRLIHDGCKSSDVSWEPVPTGKALMGSVTQSQRFSFPLVSLIPYMNRYIFLRCRLTVCRNYQTINNKDIPQCIDNKVQICREGLPKIVSSNVPTFIEVVGPMKIVDKNPVVITKKTSTDKVRTEENNTEKQHDKIDKQSLVVDGLESGTVIGIAFAAFFIGVLLMAALWFIHTHTGPLKHAVATGRAGLDGSGESTPMSTAPIAINT